MADNFLTPVGRIVWGLPSKPQNKDKDGRPLLIKKGPDMGKPATRYPFGFAIPKAGESHWRETTWGAIIWHAGTAGFPGGQTALPTFAWKVIDGDSTTPNEAMKRPCDQEGHRGHWVLRFSSSYVPKHFNRDGSAAVDPSTFYTGCYIQVAGNVAANGEVSKPGVYLNPGMVAFQGHGAPIESGPDASAVGFGQAPLPAGASATPVAGMAAPAAVAPSAVAVAPLPVAVAPAPAFIQPPPPPAPSVGPMMTAKAGGVPYAAFIAQGWTDATLRANGYLA
jgi:hypothetical protein